MDEHSKQIHQDNQGHVTGRRFLRIFAWCVSVTVLIVASVNLVAYRYMLRENNQAIVQLVAGWGRMYKPILYDELMPNVTVYGSSYARDAFDPIETGRLLELNVFNHGVSGGSAYETRRFAASSLGNPNLEAAIVNLNTFSHSEREARVRYGFDESILNVDSDNRPNRWVGLRRAYSLALTGWAAGANMKLFKAILARDDGAARSDYLRSYQSDNLTRHQPALELTKERIFPESGYKPDPSIRDLPPPVHMAELVELDLMIDGFCEQGVDVYAYYTPQHALWQACDLQASLKISTLEFLRRKQATCDAKISYFDFSYPNAVTLEGVMVPVTSSKYFRPDGHPRPTVGLLMAASMFSRKFPQATPTVLKQDFGVDLISHQDAEGWLLERAARCEGDWGDSGYTAYAAALIKGIE